MIIDLNGKTKQELISLLERVKLSTADYEVKKKNIQNIESRLYGEKHDIILKNIEEGMADIDDLQN